MKRLVNNIKAIASTALAVAIIFLNVSGQSINIANAANSSSSTATSAAKTTTTTTTTTTASASAMQPISDAINSAGNAISKTFTDMGNSVAKSSAGLAVSKAASTTSDAIVNNPASKAIANATSTATKAVGDAATTATNAVSKKTSDAYKSGESFLRKHDLELRYEIGAIGGGAGFFGENENSINKVSTTDSVGNVGGMLGVSLRDRKHKLYLSTYVTGTAQLAINYYQSEYVNYGPEESREFQVGRLINRIVETEISKGMPVTVNESSSSSNIDQHHTQQTSLDSAMVGATKPSVPSIPSSHGKSVTHYTPPSNLQVLKEGPNGNSIVYEPITINSQNDATLAIGFEGVHGNTLLTNEISNTEFVGLVDPSNRLDYSFKDIYNKAMGYNKQYGLSQTTMYGEKYTIYLTESIDNKTPFSRNSSGNYQINALSDGSLQYIAERNVTDTLLGQTIKSFNTDTQGTIDITHSGNTYTISTTETAGKNVGTTHESTLTLLSNSSVNVNSDKTFTGRHKDGDQIHVERNITISNEGGDIHVSGVTVFTDVTRMQGAFIGPFSMTVNHNNSIVNAADAHINATVSFEMNRTSISNTPLYPNSSMGALLEQNINNAIKEGSVSNWVNKSGQSTTTPAYKDETGGKCVSSSVTVNQRVGLLEDKLSINSVQFIPYFVGTVGVAMMNSVNPMFGEGVGGMVSFDGIKAVKIGTFVEASAVQIIETGYQSGTGNFGVALRAGVQLGL